MDDLLKQLVESHGPSGFEDQVTSLIEAEVSSLADEISVDALGNLIALRRGSGDGLRIMIAAHMDEIGIMVSHITKEGFLRFTNVGYVVLMPLAGSRVQFANGITGIVYNEGSLFQPDVLPLEKYYVDVGAKDKESCPVEVGDTAVFKRDYLAQGKRLTAKSMDDRVGCYVAIEVMRALKSSPHDIYFVFSVQEEVGTRGAQAAANGILPDIGIAIDVTPSGDTPEANSTSVELGKGPAIKVKDSGMIAHPGLVRALRKSADEHDQAYQLEVLLRGSTDARPIQIAGPGSAAGCISIPCRYVHSQSETVDADDVTGAIQLLAAFLAGPIEL